MAIVPPGNKQVGEVTVVTTLSAEGKKGLTNRALTGQSVVVADQPTTSLIENVQVGEFSTVATITSDNRKGLVSRTLAGYAVVLYYEPPPPPPPPPPYSFVLQNYTNIGNAVVSDNITYPIAELEPAIVEEVSTVVTFSAKANSTINHTLQAFAVVQEFVPRNELTVFNIEYAADAQFNQTN